MLRRTRRLLESPRLRRGMQLLRLRPRLQELPRLRLVRRPLKLHRLTLRVLDPSWIGTGHCR